jgi:NAD(P)-dependent dehydrogenase (short-subunit alcohol dehydrogenase family)
MGAATLKLLLAAGATVTGFDNNRENMADTLEEINEELPEFKDNLNVVYGDVTSAEIGQGSSRLFARSTGELTACCTSQGFSTSCAQLTRPTTCFGSTSWM